VLGVNVRQVRLQFATTQWGSCSPKGVIMLNTALLFMPPSLLRYVIVHELAHRVHQNHSDTYWREVERAMPSYMKPYKMLQNYRLPQA
jgi:predicted metal-dependent hydrolase